MDNSQYAIVTLANISESNNFQYNLANMRYYEGEFPDSVILKSGDLILPMTEQVEGLFGNSAFVPKENNVTFVLNQRVGLVKPFLDSDRFYIHYLLALDSVRQQLEYRATGTRQRNISPDGIYDVNVEIHEPKERERIGEFLYRLEQKVNNNNNIIQLLESKGKEFYDYWFVQFDFPDANGRPYKTSGGKMEWNETLSREIPVGWEVKTLFDFVELKTDSHNPQESPDSVYEHYSIPAFDKEQFPVMEKGAQINSSKYCVAKDDILYSKLNPSVKRIWSPFVFTDKAVCSTEFLVFRVKNMKGYSYIYSVMNDDAFQSYMIQQSSSSTGSRKRVQPSNCMNYSFAVANDELCDKYSRVYHPIFEKRKRMIIENEKLASLRDFLLPMLMNGQVTFRQ